MYSDFDFVCYEEICVDITNAVMHRQDSEEKKRVTEERLKAYEAKKAGKTAIIAKSCVILDVKPWDDETDMKAMEEQVRSIQMDGLVWGACT